MATKVRHRTPGVKQRRLKKHPSWITVHEELTLSYCSVAGCCQGQMHCPLCLATTCPPQNSQAIEAHFKENHLVDAVKTDEFVVMVCCLNCGVLKMPHYHCPVCGLMLKTATSMKHHLQCNCVIRKPGSASSDPEVTMSTDTTPTTPAAKCVEGAVKGRMRVGEKPAVKCEEGQEGGVTGRVGGKPAGQSIWDTQAKLKPNPVQRERRKQQLSQLPYAHHSMVYDVTDFDVFRCGTCCSGFHCPLCPAETFTPSNPKKVLDHLEKTHTREQVHFKGLKIMKCRLDCLPTRTRIGQSHYHCPLCPMKISIPPRFQTHIECHEKGTNKIHKRHKLGVEQPAVTGYMGDESFIAEEQLIQEAIEYRVVSGVDEGGNPVEIEVTVPKNASEAAALDSALQYLLPNSSFEVTEEKEATVHVDLKSQGHNIEGQGYSAGDVLNSVSESQVVLNTLEANITETVTEESVGRLCDLEGHTDTGVKSQMVDNEGKEIVLSKEECRYGHSGEGQSINNVNLQDLTEAQGFSGEGHSVEGQSIGRDSIIIPELAGAITVENTTQEYYTEGRVQTQGQGHMETDEKVDGISDGCKLYVVVPKQEEEVAMVTESGLVREVEVGEIGGESEIIPSKEAVEPDTAEDSKQSLPLVPVSGTIDVKQPGIIDSGNQLLEDEQVSVSMTTKVLRSAGVPCDELRVLLADTFSVTCMLSGVKEREKLTISGSWDSVTHSRECVSRIVRQRPRSLDELDALVSGYRGKIQGVGGRDGAGGVKRMEVGGGEIIGEDSEEGGAVKEILAGWGGVGGVMEIGVQRSGFESGQRGSTAEELGQGGVIKGEVGLVVGPGAVLGERGGIDGTGAGEGRGGRIKARLKEVEGKYKGMLRVGGKTGVGETDARSGVVGDGGRGQKISRFRRGNLVADGEGVGEEWTGHEVTSVVDDGVKTIGEEGSILEEEEEGSIRSSGEQTSHCVGGTKRKLMSLRDSEACKEASSGSSSTGVAPFKRERLANDRGEGGQNSVKTSTGVIISTKVKDKTERETELIQAAVQPVVVLKPALHVKGENVIVKEEEGNDLSDQIKIDVVRELTGSNTLEISIATVAGGDGGDREGGGSGKVLVGEERKGVALPGGVEEDDEVCPICKQYRGESREDLLLHILSTNCIQSCHRKKRNLAKGLCTQIDRMNKCRSSVCFLCKREFSGIKQAKIHYALMMCCKKQKKNPHNIPKHPESGQYLCELCGYEASIPHKVWQHMQRKHLQKEYPCDLCDELFTTTRFMEIHKERVHMDTAMSVCEQCGKEMYAKYMKRHYNDVHNPNYTRASRMKQTTPLSCTHCSYTTFILDDLHRHMRRQHGERKYHCHVCSSTFAFQGDLNLHMKTIHGEREVTKCQFCDKQVLKKHLSLHIRNIHENVKSFVCPVCGKGLQTKFSLKYHIETHKKPQDRQYKFKCSSCHSGFMNRSVLRDHMNCHTGSRPYQCQMCQKSFRQRSVYHKHLEIHNNVKFMCAFCGLIFASKKAVFDHKELVHTEPQLVPRPPNVCVCGVTTDSAYMLTRHQEDCAVYQATAQILSASGCTDSGMDNTGQKTLPSLDKSISVSSGVCAEEGMMDDAGNSLISPQEAAAILEQEGSEFMAREVIQLDNGTMLVIQEENKEENKRVGNTDQTDSQPVDNSSYLCGYCNLAYQSMDEIEQHMLTLHSAESMGETSGNQLIVDLGEGHATALAYVEQMEVGHADLETNQPEQFIQTSGQSAALIVSNTSQLDAVEEVTSSDCLPVIKTEVEDEVLTYEVLN